MKRLLPLLLVVVLAACNAPKPVAPAAVPSVSPSLIPSVSPSLIPSLAPSTTPAPTAEPTRGSIRPAMDASLLPAVEQTLDLGSTDFANSYLPVPLALDAQADRLYVSLSPSRTLVLDANTLAAVGEIPFGGALSVNPDAQRLYIGVPGNYTYNPDGTTGITPAELKLIDTSNLALLRSAIYSNTSTTPPLVAVDAINNRIYVTQNGVTIADATTLEVQGILSGTFPVPGAPVPHYTAIDAAVLPPQQRLFVSLNNGIPGSNNGNVLAVYHLPSGQMIAQDGERSVSGFAVDETTGEVISPRSHIATRAIVKYDSQGNVLKRLDGLAGLARIDPVHDRVYLFEGNEVGQIVTLDRELNLLGVSTYPGSEAGTAFAIVDTERDHLYVLQDDGKLIVLAGHAAPIGLAPLPAPDRKAVLSIIPASADSQSLYALFAPDEYTGNYGSLSRSIDEGATWTTVNAWPVNAFARADGTLFAAIDQNGPASLGIWRSIDQEQTWQPASHGLNDLAINRMVASPEFAADGTLYALSKRGVFRSTDRGATWTSLADGYAPLLKDQTVSFQALAVSPDFAQDNTLLIGHTGGLWRSTDRGETWTIVSGGPAANRLAYAPDGSLVLAINYDGVHRSDDGGLTWRLFNDGLDPSSSTIGDVQINDREAMILVTSFGQPGAIYRRPSGGATWQRVPIDADVSALALTPEGRLFIGTTAGRVQRVP
jgi:photosystem II stability/assembly factor-like uncharacterized protein